MAFAVSPRCPALNRSDLTANRFSTDRRRSIHEQLKPRILQPGAAVHVAFPFVANNEQLDIGREVIKKIEVVLASPAEIVERDPIVRPDIDQTPAVADFLG